MDVLDLFSGIGGFCLGFEQAGMRTLAFCEIDPFCQAVLRRHWPRIPIHPDIRQLDATRYRGTVDLVCGGYPCQPFSQAGFRRGTKDERHLWSEMYRVIREIRPRWVVAENVAGHIGLGFDQVAASLEAQGYTVWPFIIPASAVNAPHRRNRLWIIAHADGKRCQGIVNQLPASRRRRSQLPAPLPPFSSETFFGDELPPPVLCGKDDGVPHRSHRLRALGNAIVPHIAEIIGRAIVDFEKSRSSGELR